MKYVMNCNKNVFVNNIYKRWIKKNNGEKYNSMSRDHLVDNSVKSLDKVNQI